MAKTQPLTAVKRGNLRIDTTMDWSHRGSRTQNQYDAVIAHFRRHPAAWQVGNPFGEDYPGQQFHCNFHHCYIDQHGCMCSFMVSTDGRVEYFTRDKASEIMAGIAMATARKYGLFRG